MTPLVLLCTYCESWFQRKTPTQLKIDWKRPMYENGWSVLLTSIYFLLLAIVTHALLEFPTRYLWPAKQPSTSVFRSVLTIADERVNCQALFLGHLELSLIRTCQEFFFICLKFHKLPWLNIIMKDKIKTNRDAQNSCVGCTENVIKHCQVVSAAEI